MRENITLGASLLAAITASLCCIGPLAATLVGIGSFGAATVFEAWRPYLLGITFALLAAAFYFTYRKREVVCADGTCKVSSAPRWNKLLLWIATVVVILFATFPHYSGPLLANLNRGADLQTEPNTLVSLPRPTKTRIADLDNLDQLRQLFQSHNGKVRLISLLSPT